MKAPLPSETWPLYPVRMLRPISAIAKTHTRANCSVLKRSSTNSGASSATTRTAAAAATTRRSKPRTDPVIDLDTGHAGPAEEAAGPHQQDRHDDDQAEGQADVARPRHVGADQRQHD